jgi:type I restriction enzyme S subunit
VNKTLKPGWSYKKLDELGFVGRGKSKHRPRNDPSLYGGKYPFIQTAEVTASEFYITKYSGTYSDLGLAQSKLWHENTLCIVNAGENTAETAILKFKACFPDSIIGFIADQKKADVRFVKYYLTTIKPQLRSVTKGATQDNLSVSKLLSFDILTPPIYTQHKIAAILSAYDDLIENNRRRIEILEEMARSLYREWFVNFRFPGHEQVKMVDSELGLIPEGWEVKQLGNIVLEIIDYRGKTPKKLGSDWSESGILAISAKNIKQGKLINLDKSNFVDEALYNKWMKSELKQGDILMTSEAPLGELYYLVKHQKFCLSQRVYSIRANPDIIKPSILFSALYSPLIQEQIYARQSGTTVLGIRQTELRKVPVIVPSINLQTSASQILDDLFKSIETLQRKNANLRQTRDLLLPKLISGEIDVENLDINTGEIAA